MSLKLDLAITILLVGFEQPIEAHDIYAPLKDRWGNSCCNNEDCHPAPYRVTSSGVQMLLGGDWIAVPDHTIQYRALPGDTGETAGGHWCGEISFMLGGRARYLTHCAILPPSAAMTPKRSLALCEGNTYNP